MPLQHYSYPSIITDALSKLLRAMFRCPKAAIGKYKSQKKADSAHPESDAGNKWVLAQRKYQFARAKDSLEDVAPLLEKWNRRKD